MKLGMWTFLASDIVLFGAFIGSYAFVRVAYGWTTGDHDLIPAEHLRCPASSTRTCCSRRVPRRAGDGRRRAREQARDRRRARRDVRARRRLPHQHGDRVEPPVPHQHGGVPERRNLSTNIASSTFYLTTGLHAAHVIAGSGLCVSHRTRLAGGVLGGQQFGGVLRTLLALRGHRLAVPLPAVLHPDEKMNRKRYTVIYVVLFASRPRRPSSSSPASSTAPTARVRAHHGAVGRKAVGVAAYYRTSAGTTGRHVPRARRDCCCARADRRGGVLDTVRVSGPDKLETDRDEKETAATVADSATARERRCPRRVVERYTPNSRCHRGPPHRPRRPQAPLSTGSRRGRR